MAKKLFDLPELDTRNILHIVEENFQRVGLKAYAVRMIYTGEHTLSKEEITNHFKKTVRDVNSHYCEIHIHGFLLVYDSYFVHILEGSEDTVHRQLRFLFKREEEYIKQMEEEHKHEEVTEETPKKDWKMFRRSKMLMMYHSITKRLFETWRAVNGRPPALVGKLNIHGPLNEHMEQVRICLDKISKLCTFAIADDHLTFEGLAVTDPKIEALPEVALLDFLLQSPHVMDLHHVFNMHRCVDDYSFYFEHVWPLSNHFTPRHLYKLKIDDSFVQPLPVMPWETKKEEKEERQEGDEVEERQSVSSDSD